MSQPRSRWKVTRTLRCRPEALLSNLEKLLQPEIHHSIPGGDGRMCQSILRRPGDKRPPAFLRRQRPLSLMTSLSRPTAAKQRSASWRPSSHLARPTFHSRMFDSISINAIPLKVLLVCSINTFRGNNAAAAPPPSTRGHNPGKGEFTLGGQTGFPGLLSMPGAGRRSPGLPDGAVAVTGKQAPPAAE